MNCDINSLSVWQKPRPKNHTQKSSRGFSLLEVTIALSISGFLFSAIWQLTATAGVQREAAALSSQALIVTSAAKDYISGQNTVLLALPQLSALGNVARVKITDDDTGDTANSIQSAGYLPQDFTNLNSYGQSYALFVKREDGGSPGVADNGDRVIGLLVTTGGTEISDQMGSRIASSMGAPGGFIYDEGNPANPAAATDAHGAAGGWKVNLTSAGWSSIGTVAQAGRIATLVNLVPSGMGVGGGGGGGASEIDGLSDGIAAYGTTNNIGLGEGALVANTSGTDNIAIGRDSQINSTGGQGNVAIGSRSLSNTAGYGNVAVGMQQLTANTSGVTNIALGLYNLNANTSGSWNIALGRYVLASNTTGSNNIGMGSSAGGMALYMNTTGSHNIAIGDSALFKNTTASNNIGIGQQAGLNITTGINNIMIGPATDPPALTSNNRLNIGNTIYGDLSTDQISIGSATLTAGIGLDVGSNTSASRLSVGTTAQRPTCNAGLVGAQRWNTTFNSFEVCGSTGWMQLPLVPPDGTPMVAMAGSGYFVVTAGSWDGNLGGMAGANAKCLSDLTANDWMGKSDAISRGMLNAAKVRAFNTASEGVAQIAYYFAVSGEPLSGGAAFTTSLDGTGVGNTINWSGSNYFNGARSYWVGYRSPWANYWSVYNNSNANTNCNGWTDSSGTQTGLDAVSNSSGNGRFMNAYMACDQPHHLICWVHP